MNWISFAKQRPKEEPKRRILVLYSNGVFDTTIPGLMANDHNIITHWAEIEGPSKEPEREPDSDSLEKLCWELVEIVEGVGSLRWTADGGGLRLKDTKEWAKFYVAVSKFRNRAKLEPPPKPDPFEQ